MPFTAYDHAWVNERFGDMDLRANESLFADRSGR